jgi:2-oxoglutarate ferredoxin oxidoreductase subunit beta
MTTPDDYSPASDTAWCPGCGNFGIREAVQQALEELEIAPWQVVFVSGIGQAAKLPQYIRCNNFDGLHGRALPAATGVLLANHKLTVIAEAGDGDIYSEGTNHLMHAMRRNVNVTCLVHNNQVYGLTKGQFSPTSGTGFHSGTSPDGSEIPPYNPLAFAVAMQTGFAARGFAGDVTSLKDIIKQAIGHTGFSLVDILQPCVTFNKVNTFKWYKDRVYYVDEKHDPTDQAQAFAKALEWPDPAAPGDARIPLGVICRDERPSLERQLPQIVEKPLVEVPVGIGKFRELIERHR